MNTPNFHVTMLAGQRAKIAIYDDIGPSRLGMIDAKAVSAALDKLGAVNSIEVRINSRGGSGFEGLGIASILQQHPAKVDVYIDGVAASAASLVAMAGDTVYMPRNALMFIHDPLVITEGNEEEHRKSIEALQAVKQAGVALYVGKTGKSAADIAAMMAAETWLTAEQAVAQGFADLLIESLPADRVPQNRESLMASFKQAPWMALPKVEPKLTITVAPEDAPATLEYIRNTVEKEHQKHRAILLESKMSEASQDDARYRGEYDANPHLRAKMSFSEYRESRLIDDGKLACAPRDAELVARRNRKRETDAAEARTALASAATANERYTVEWQRSPVMQQKISLPDYIATRRVDDGLDSLTPTASL